LPFQQRRTIWLNDKTLVAVFARDPLAIKVLQHRDSLFSRQASQQSEARDIERLAAEFIDSRPQLCQSALVDVQCIRSHPDEDLVAKEESHQPAQLGI
jgi:hypothetical protein